MNLEAMYKNLRSANESLRDAHRREESEASSASYRRLLKSRILAEIDQMKDLVSRIEAEGEGSTLIVAVCTASPAAEEGAFLHRKVSVNLTPKLATFRTDDGSHELSIPVAFVERDGETISAVARSGRYLFRILNVEADHV